MKDSRIPRPADPQWQLDDVRPDPLFARLAAPRGGTPPSPNNGVERRDVPARERLVERVRQEFEEMPGMCLTVAQAHRLFGLREDVCVRVLESLVLVGLLDRVREGQYGLKQTAR